MKSFIQKSLYVTFSKMIPIFVAGCALICPGFNIAYGQTKITGDAVQVSELCYRLTRDVDFQVGGMFQRQKVNLDNDFLISVRMNFGMETSSNSGADGIAFVMLTDTLNLSSIAGGSLGYEGIAESLVVEFDTYQNTENNDPPFDHIALIINATPVHNNNTIAGPFMANGVTNNIEDGNFHNVVFSWDVKLQEFAVYFNCRKVLGYVGPLALPFFKGNKEVYWGFTASTGGMSNEQTVCLTKPVWVNVLKDVVYCEPTTVNLDAGTGSKIYRWTPEDGISDPHGPSPSVFVDTTRTFYLEKIDFCGVHTLDSMTVQIVPNDIALELGADTSICRGETISLSVQEPGIDYEWSTGATTQSIDVASAGVYSVIADNGICLKTDMITISEKELPFIVLGPDTTICRNIPLVLSTETNATQVTWSDGTTGSQLIVKEAGTYRAIVSNECGESTDEIRIELENCEDYFIPNAFSPNNDGINDYFGPTESSAIINIEHMAVFNRWGAVIFESSNFTPKEEKKMWNGRFRGSVAEPGVYLYMIRMHLKNGKKVLAKGSVTLIK